MVPGCGKFLEADKNRCGAAAYYVWPDGDVAPQQFLFVFNEKIFLNGSPQRRSMHTLCFDITLGGSIEQKN